MGDVGEYWRDHKEHLKAERAKRLAETPREGWSFHTDVHWYRMLNGKKLDFWPTTGKWQYDGRVYHFGDVHDFIKTHGPATLEAVLIDTDETRMYDTIGVKIREPQPRIPVEENDPYINDPRPDRCSTCGQVPDDDDDEVPF